MGRPRKASDEEVFGAVHRLMSRLGPLQWTLADVASEVGLTAGALVQRYGSKRELLVALMARFAGSTPELFAGLRAQANTPLATVYAYAGCMAEMGRTPTTLAHHLAYLQLDLTDPDLYRHLQRQAQDSRAAIAGLVEEAFAAGELVGRADLPATATDLARAVEVALSGSLLVWAFHPEGTVTEFARTSVTTVLRPWLPYNE